MKGRKDWNELQEVAIRQGWKVTISGGNHLRWKAPDGRIVFSASTPSDGRAIKNLKALLRRTGLRLDH